MARTILFMTSGMLGKSCCAQLGMHFASESCTWQRRNDADTYLAVSGMASCWISFTFLQTIYDLGCMAPLRWGAIHRGNPPSFGILCHKLRMLRLGEANPKLSMQTSHGIIKCDVNATQMRCTCNANATQVRRKCP